MKRQGIYPTIYLTFKDEKHDDFNVVEQREEFKKWYNGYIFGSTVIYNPWSVLSYLKSNDDYFMPYWVNTSENKIIKNILAKGSEGLKNLLKNYLGEIL